MEEVYEKLFDIWSKERASAEIAQVPTVFFEELAEYLAQQRRRLKLSERDSVNAQLSTAEMEMLHRLLESLLRIRLRKIISAVFQQTSLENLLPFEKKTYNALQRAVSQHEAVILSGLADPRVLMRESESRHDVVVFLKDFPRFVGEDLNSYGPFKAGDVATIYSGNISALVRRNIVRLVKSV